MLAGFALASGGPLGFPEFEKMPQTPPVADCGTCAFVTTFEPIPEPARPGDLVFILVFLTMLAAIGLLGTKWRVRTKG